MENEKISVVVPVYNCEKYIGDCIESIRSQTYKNIEIILVDDGSKDASGVICDNFATQDDRIRVIHIKNDGVSHARNTGIENSTGGWITFVDSDDYIEPDMCENAYNKACENHTDIVMWNIVKHKEEQKFNFAPVGSDDILYDKQDFINIQKMILTGETPTGDIPISIRGPYCKLIRRDVALKCRFPETLSFSEDWCFMLQLLDHAESLFYVNKQFYHYIVRKNSLCNHFDYKYYVKIYKFINWINIYMETTHGQDMTIKKYVETMNMNYLFRMIDYYFFLVDSVSMKQRRMYVSEYESLSECGFSDEILSECKDKKAVLKYTLYSKKLFWLMSVWRFYQVTKTAAVIRLRNIKNK
ncbi:MAG: glycosyltransferase family 2 protein [Oscillospiraceae bacterium]|nr:glycosyltransferase family 2 protein [Oscillospiraceae bacterium]